MLSQKLVSISVFLAFTTAAFSHENLPAFGARLSGFDETPSILTKAVGTFDGSIDSDGQALNFTLNYSGLSAPVLFAHIHFGKDRVAGAVIAFLCGGGNKPACPQEGTVTGTLTPADVVQVDAQGIPGNSFDALADAIVSDSAYANVHTQAHPAGEIRGQLKF
jgi:hypothetical protein